MRKGILGSLAVLTAGAGLAFGQPKTPPTGPTGPSSPPPGMVPMGPMGPPGFMSPDGQPFQGPGGMEGMAPPGYGDPGMGMGGMGQGDPNQPGGYGSGRGLFGGSGRQGPPRLWVGADYLIWAPRSFSMQYPLVTTSSAPDFGIVGRPTTSSLGPLDRPISFDSVTGLRPWICFSLDESGELGAEFSAFWMNSASREFSYTSNEFGLPTLAIPFVDTNTITHGSYIVASPAINTGSIRVSAKTEALGGEANMVYNAYNSGSAPGGLTLLAGARFFELRESFQLDTASNTFGVPPAPVPPGALGSSYFPGGGGFFSGAFFGPAFAPYSATTTDYIRTTNSFYGGQVGFKGDIGLGNFFLNLVGKGGAGYMRQYIDLHGSTNFVANGVTSSQVGGLLNLPQDLYRHRRDQFAMIGEGNVNVGYQVGSFLRLQAGYTFMWVSNVLRPTPSISQTMNPSMVPISPTFNGSSGPPAPARDIVGATDYHLSGFNFGIQLSF